MARFATTITIAGVDFSGYRALLLDGFQFADSEKGSMDWAMDSTPHPQMIDTQHKGTQFGVQIGGGDTKGGVEIAMVNETIAAIKLAQTTNGYFVFNYEDEHGIVNVRAIRDVSQRWYDKGPFSEGYVEGITFRFVVRQVISVTLSE